MVLASSRMSQSFPRRCADGWKSDDFALCAEKYPYECPQNSMLLRKTK